MPLYHFHLAGNMREDDPTGTELASDAEARRQAIKFTGEYLKDSPDLLSDEADIFVRVTNDDDHTLFTIHVRIAVHESLH